MRRTHLARSIIKDLERQINVSKDKKKEILNYLDHLKRGHASGKISYSKYVEGTYLKREGLDLKEWIAHLDHHIERCEKKISEKKKELFGHHASNFLAIFFALALIIGSVIYLQPKFIGFAVQQGQTQEFFDLLNMNFSQSDTYEWSPENDGKIESLKVSGTIEGKGEVKIYFGELLVFDSAKEGLEIKTQQRGIGLTGNTIAGFAVLDENSSAGGEADNPEITNPDETQIDNQQDNSNSSIQDSANEEQSSQNETIANAEEANSSSEVKNLTEVPENETVGPSQQESPQASDETREEAEKTIEVSVRDFFDVCEETCDLGLLNLTEGPYNIRVETEGGTTLNIERITYGLSVQEEIPENATLENATNITEANIISEDTVQQRAVLGQPVKWTKTIKLDKEGVAKVKIPEEAKNIDISKIDGENREEPGIITGNIVRTVPGSASGGFFSRMFSLTGNAIGAEPSEPQKEIELELNENATEYEIGYETSAPYSTEENTVNGKKITISGPDSLHYENVLAFADLPESFGIRNPSALKIYWVENSTYISPTSINDTNKNGIYDHVEWNVPHLSNQTFEIIVVIKAEHLDSGRNFISDIYNQVRLLDDSWSETINEGEYARIFFSTNLTNEKDITIFARTVSGTPSVEVYEKDSSTKIGEFFPIKDSQYDRIYLYDLAGSQDTFDLKVVGGSVEFDHIKDPTLTIDAGATELCGEVTAYDTIHVTSTGILQICAYNGTSGTGYANISLGNNGNFTLDLGGLIDGSGRGVRGGSSGTSTSTCTIQGEDGNGFASGANSCSANGGGGGGALRGGGTSNSVGGAGGGFGGGGGIGGESISTNTQGEGGGSYGTVSSQILLAGSGGGGDSGDSALNGEGGNGGAGLRIDAGSGVISINGVVNLSGGQGGSGDSTDDSGGGGGSGGHLIIYGSALNLDSGIINIGGGVGGDATGSTTSDSCGGGGGGGGRIVYVYGTISNTSITESVSGGAEGVGTDTNCNADSDAGDNTAGSDGTIFYNQTSFGDATAPSVTINIPTNTTYYTLIDFPLTINVSLDENGSVMYSLDGGATNISLNTTDNQNFNGTLDAPGDGQYTFQVYANDTSGNSNYSQSVVFTVSTENIVVNATVIDATGNAINSTVIIYDEGNDNYVYNETNETNEATVALNSTYTVEVQPLDIPTVDSVVFAGLNLSDINDTTIELLNLDENTNDENFSTVFAIDNQINQTADIYFTAQGNTLYECTNYDFSGQSCLGTWDIFLESLDIGSAYSFAVQSDQDPAFGIINITNAEHLNSTREFLTDITNDVKFLDGVWSETIPSGDYARVTFEKNLTSVNDITIYPKTISGTPSVEVYKKDQSTLIANFTSINDNEYNTKLLTTMPGTEDVFDLHVVGGSVQFDHIVDPSVNATSFQNYYFQLAENSSNSTYQPFKGGQTGTNAVPFVTMSLNQTNLTGDFWRMYLPDVFFNSTGVIVNRTYSVSTAMNVSVNVVEFGTASVMVQSGTFAITSSSTVKNTNVTLGTAVNTSAAAMVFYYNSNDATDNYQDNSIKGVLKNSTFLNFSLDSSATTGRKAGHWYVFESLDGGFTVQSADLNYAATATTSVGTINSVDTSKTFLIASYSTGETSDDPQDGSLNITLQNSTSIVGNRSASASALINATVYAITFTGDESVQRGSFTYASGTKSAVATISSVNTSMTMAWNPVLTGRMNNGIQSSREGAFQLLNITNSTAITGTRINSTGGAGGSWEVVQWVQPVSVSDSTSPSVTINFPTNTTYLAVYDLPFNFSVSLDENGSAVYSLDNGVTNVTMNTTNNQNFTATLDTLPVGTYNFSVYANDTSGNVNYSQSVVFTLDQQNIVVNATVIDATGNAINSTVIIYDEGNDNYVYNETNDTNEAIVPLNSTYTVEIQPIDISSVDSVVFTGLNFSEINDTNVDLVNIDEHTNDSNFSKVFAIDNQYNQAATIHFTAQSTSLYKCSDYNFTDQSCPSSWTAFLDGLEIGKAYSFEVSPGDPGYGLINISKAEHLNSTREFISDITNDVKFLDGVWSETIPSGDYARVTFEKNLTSDNDITIYPRNISGTPSVEIYEKDQSTLIANFTAIADDQYNTKLLTSLAGSQDTFDLHIVGGSVQFDHIVDPSVNATNIQYYYFQVAAATNTSYLPFKGGQTNSNIVPFATRSFNDSSTVAADIWMKYLPNIFFNSTGVIVNRTNSTSVPLNVSVYAIQFGTGSVKVQSGNFTLTSSSTLKNTNASISTAVNTSAAAMVFYYATTTGPSIAYNAHMIKGSFFNSTLLNFSVDPSATTGTKSGTWYVFESLDGGFTVQSVNIDTALANSNATINSVNTSKTFLIASYGSNTASRSPLASGINVSLQNSTQINLTRAVGATGLINATVFAVTFNPQGSETVQRGGLAYAAGTKSAVAVINSVNATTSIAWNPVLTGTMTNTLAGPVSGAFQIVNLTNSTGVTGTRVNSSGAAGGSFEVIQWVAPTADTTFPTWSNASTNNTTPSPGDTVEHEVLWTDNSALINDTVTLEINSTGASCNTKANVSTITLSGTTAWANISWQVPSACEGKTVGWRQYANDSSGNWNSTALQAYAVGNSPPVVSFGTNPPDAENRSNSSVTFDLKVSDNSGVGYLRLYGNWTGSWAVNQTNSSPINDTFWNVTVLGISEGKYLWAAWGNDTSGNAVFTATNRTFTIDTVNPLVSLGANVLANNSNASASYITLNVSYTELNPSNITYRISNSTGIWNSTNYLTSGNTTNVSINWTGLSDGVYDYNATVYDIAGNSNTTQTRRINLDTVAPTSSSNMTNSTKAGQAVLHSVLLADSTGLSGYIFSFNNGTGSFTNDTWVPLIGTSNWSNVTKVANSTAGSIINWTVYFNDSSNNWAGTGNFNYTTTATNSAPTIIYVNSTDPVDPTIGSSTTVTVNFTVRDVDGTGDINLSTTAAYLQRSGETTRSNTSCINLTGAVGNDLNLTCTIKMWYYDQNGAWTINTTVFDNSALYGENSTKTFTYNLQTAMVMYPTALNWPTISVIDTNTGSTNNPIVINNSGNADPLNINITAYNLQGNVTTTDYIFANNFTVDNVTAGCSGTAMVNATSTNVTNAYLHRGNNSLNFNNDTSGQEQIYFCLKGLQTNPAIKSQGYSSQLYGSWTIQILAAYFLVVVGNGSGRRKKKKEGKIDDDRLIDALNIITDELKEEYSLNKKELVKVVMEKLQKRYGISKGEILDMIKQEDVKIPVSIFSGELGALESLVRYMKENLNMTYRNIARDIERNERTIWGSYKKAMEKQKGPAKIDFKGLEIPLSIFKNKDMTVLESLIVHLKKGGMRYREIGKLLGRDERNIWTTYSRAVKKESEKRD